MEKIVPVYSGEVMLAGWRENHANGATVTFWLPEPSDLDVFRGMTVKKGNVAGQRLMAVLVEIGDDEQPVQAARAAQHDGPPPYGNVAADLYRNGFFFIERVLEAVGPDTAYKGWCTARPCALTGAPPPSVCFHGNGNGYAGFPVNRVEIENAKALPEQKVRRETVRHLSRWMAQTVFGEQSMGHVAPERVLRWAEASGIVNFLPRSYREGGDA